MIPETTIAYLAGLSAMNLRNPPNKQMTRKAPIPADLLVREWPTPVPASLMDGGAVL